jgi:hypothetical protein
MKQNQKSKFLTRLGRIREKYPDTTTWLEDIGRDPNDVDRNNQPRYDLWALLFDEGGHRLGMMTINGPGSLNNIFKEARELSVTSLVEIIFYKSVKYFAERDKCWNSGSTTIHLVSQNPSHIGGEKIKGKYTYGESVPERAKIWGSNGSKIYGQQD